MFHSGFYRGAINRSYYAMFYCVLALAVLRQETTSKHSGIISFFDREFVKTGTFPREYSKILHLSFQKRQENDYGEVFSVAEHEARDTISDAHNFVTTISNYLNHLIGLA